MRLRKRLKPFGKLYPFLFKVFRLRVGLWLVSLGLYTFRPRRKRRGGEKGRKGGRGGGKKKGRRKRRKSGGGIKGGKGG